MSITPKGPRIVTGPNQDTTGRTITQDYQAPAYGAEIDLVLKAQNTVVNVGALTGVLTLTADTESPLIGDELNILLTGDSVDRVVTFDTGFSGLATITVAANSYGSAKFIFNGLAWVCVSSGTLGIADVQTPAYASTISITTSARNTKVLPAQLTGALTINMVTTNAVAGDSIEFAFKADGTNRTITFGTGWKTSGTLTVTASKFAGLRGIYDGTEWIATGREISA